MHFNDGFRISNFNNFCFPVIWILFQTAPMIVEVIVHFVYFYVEEMTNSKFCFYNRNCFDLALLLDKQILLHKNDSGCLCELQFWIFSSLLTFREFCSNNFIFSFFVVGVFCKTYKLIIHSLYFLENNHELIT